MSRRVLMAAGVPVVAVAVVAALVWRPWDAGVPEDAAFTIGDREVSISELDRRNESLRALYGVQEPAGGSELEEFQRQAAKSMALSIVLERAAEEEEVEASDEKVDAALRRLIDSRFGGQRKAYVDGLGNVGTSEEEVRAELRRQLELQQLLDAVTGDVEVTPDEVEAAFAERKAELGRPQTRAVSNIVVTSRRDAIQVRRQLDSGADVATLAGQVSIDAATRDKGGALGKVAKDELVPAVGKAVFSTKRGQAYGPVKGPQGWNVGVVTRIFPPQAATLAGSRKELRSTLETEEKQAQWKAWLEERLRDADIEYAETYRPEDPFEMTQWPGEKPAPGPGSGEEAE